MGRTPIYGDAKFEKSLKKYWDMGWSSRKIGKKLGCSYGVVIYHGKQLGLTPNYNPIRKSIDVKKLIKCYKKGWTLQQLREHFGISNSTIYYYIKKLNVKQETVYCQDCGNEIQNPQRHQKRCKKCREKEQQEFLLIRSTRAVFARIAKTSHDVAERLQNEMSDEEGPEFTEWVLDGVLEDVENKKLGEMKNEK